MAENIKVDTAINLITHNATLCEKNKIDLVMNTRIPGCSSSSLRLNSKCQLVGISVGTGTCSFMCGHEKLSDELFVLINSGDGLETVNLCEMFISFYLLD